ncbi:MAG: (2Fe-2S)-binding protein [Candidatus Methanosuratincola petrocarbonis]
MWIVTSPSCPICKKQGLPVDRATVICHAKESVWPIGEVPYYICENSSCKVVYYSTKGYLTKAEVKTRVTFKENDPPRPLCYCKQVTEEDVIGAIGKGANTVEQVIEATGIGGGGLCKFTNPYGRCCSRHYLPFIKRALESRKGQKSVQSEPSV